MQKHRVLTDGFLNRIFENSILILGDSDCLVNEFVFENFLRQNDRVFAQLHGLSSEIRVVTSIRRHDGFAVSIVVVETILRVFPFTVFLIKLLISYFIAYILDDTGDILVSLAHQAVLSDAPQVEVVVQLARLLIRQFQFADEFCESLLLTAKTYALGGYTRDVGEEDDGSTEDECHELIATGTLAEEHQHKERH